MDTSRLLEDERIYASLEDLAEARITPKQFYQMYSKTQIMRYVKRSELEYALELFNTNFENNRNMEVVYLVGNSGSGKTTAAKYFADLLGYDCFISGGGDDILDGYKGQTCIVLDDYRGSVMKFNEFLKFIDNHTNSMIASRYHNKDISHCKLIIITSVQEPAKLYRITDLTNESGEEEPLEQLMRRLKHKIYRIENNKILVEYEDGSKEFFMDMKEVWKASNIDLSKKDTSSIMDQLKRKTDPQELVKGFKF